MKLFKLLLLFFLSITTTCHGQQKISKTDYWRLKPFDAGSVPVTGKLPPSFLGHRIDQIFAASQRIATLKGTYETTAHFEQRKRAARNRPLFGQIYSTSNVTLVLDADSSYDADTSTLTLKLKGYLSDDGSAIEFNLGGSDASGVRIKNMNDFFFTQNTELISEGFFVTSRMTVAPEKAKRVRESLSVAVSGTLQEPLFINSFCNMRIKSITFYDYTSGYVYNRINAS